MGYDVTEIKTIGGRVLRTIETCDHSEAVPVMSAGEVVAHLCPDCDRQLSAYWG